MKIISTPHLMVSPPVKDVNRREETSKPSVRDSDLLEKIKSSRGGNDLSSLGSAHNFPEVTADVHKERLKIANNLKNSLDDTYPERIELLKLAQKRFIEKKEIIPPKPLSSRENASITFDGKGISWVHQISKTTRSLGTGVAADGVWLALNMARPPQCEPKDINFKLNSIQRSTISEAQVLVSQLGIWRHTLDTLCHAHISSGMLSPMNKTLEITLAHLATNIHQYLTIHGKVLIPVDISVQVPSLKGASQGHAAVLYIEKAKDDKNFKFHFFETSGELGGSYSYNAITEYCKAEGKRALFDKFTQEELRTINHPSNTNGTDFELRFSRWEVESKSGRSIRPEDIQIILAQTSVIEKPLDTFSGLNNQIAEHQSIQMENIFSWLNSFGEVRVPSQFLSLAQVGGECEHESLMAFCDHYLGIVDKNMAINVRKELHSVGIDFAEEYKDTINSNIDELKKNGESRALSLARKRETRLLTRSMVEEHEELLRQDKNKVSEGKTDKHLLELSIESLNRWNALFDDI